jgi:DNA-directed RNA polymerase subunit RPC12/RpoP
MTIYKCETCQKEFNRKSTYDNHLLRKNPCKLDNYVDNQCEYCDKKYSTKFNLNKHFNNCTKKIIANDSKLQIEELKKMFEKKLDEQQKKIEELSHLTETNKNIVNNTNTNSNNNNTTTNNIINIFSAGKEDLSRLSKEEIIKICTSGTYYPLVAAEIIHCNEKYPEFQNFLISNLRSNTGQVLINDKWITKPNDEIISNLMHVDKRHVSTLMKDLEVEDKLKIRLESTKDEIDTNESKQHMKSKIRTKLYNARNMIIKNKKIVEKTPKIKE